MAERRMFAKTIIDSDAFLDMPLSTQALYFHLSMRADDDGFINNPKKIQRMVGCGDDDLKLLIAKAFILPFESGVVVIKHWKIHNYIRSDRYKPTVYTAEKAALTVKENGAYTLGIPSGIPTVDDLETQDRIGKGRVGKDSIGECIEEPESALPNPPAPTEEKKPTKHKHGEYKNVLLTEEEFNKLGKEFGKSMALNAIEFLDEYIEMKGYKAKSHYLAIRKWVIDAIKERSQRGNRGGYGNRNNGNVYTLSNGEQTNNPFLADMDKSMNGDDLPFTF